MFGGQIFILIRMWTFYSFSIKYKYPRKLFNSSTSTINAFDIVRRTRNSNLMVIAKWIIIWKWTFAELSLLKGFNHLTPVKKNSFSFSFLRVCTLTIRRHMSFDEMARFIWHTIDVWAYFSIPLLIFPFQTLSGKYWVWKVGVTSPWSGKRLRSGVWKCLRLGIWNSLMDWIWKEFLIG